jgi:glycerophosphoryl diester phosphodiesterase
MPELSERRLRRVGHKGADLIAPGNTYASFDAALAAGVDMIEFDVLPQGERLILAHDYEDAEGRAPHTLEEGLDHLASDAFAGIELDVDMKLPGYELRVVDALRSRGLLDRSLISTQYPASMDVIRAAEPNVRIGWSVPRVRRDPFRHRGLAVVAQAAVVFGRAILPSRAAAVIRAGRCDALMVHWRLLTPRLVSSVHRAGGEVYVWTVDELPRMREVIALGVTGVITNDPRLFSGLAA